MATAYENVRLVSLAENGTVKSEYETTLRLQLINEKRKAHVRILNGDSDVRTVLIDQTVEVAKVGTTGVLLSTKAHSYLLTLDTDKDATRFHHDVKEILSSQKNSAFSVRTDAASAEQYFQFYGYLSQQQNMMQDYIRTSTYQRAMLDNCADFQDKVVLDVGAGSGILSFFAVQAGARKVYAIEASSMALHCQTLVDGNTLKDRVEVIPGKIEEEEIPEKVDIIISEPMGYMLFNERMLETFLHAKKWLKPGGRIFPTQGDLHITPFTDESLYMEQFSKANFWYQQSFHGVDLSSLREAAIQEYFKQPIVDTFDIRICMARSHKYTVDFQSAHENDLHNIEIPVSFTMLSSGTVHGLAFWFDCAFIGSQSTVWLSTSPTQPLTHWYQVRCLLQNPVFVKQGQTLTGKVSLHSNKRQSYDVEIELTVPGTNHRSSNSLDLKNPFFRYTGQAPAPPPGTNHQSPSDAYWNSTDPTVTEVYDVCMVTNDEPVLSYQLANVAPINPGCIPSATVVSTASSGPLSPAAHIQSRTSIGGGISPSAFISQSHNGQNPYVVSNQFMIGDYAIPGSVILPTQGLNLNHKS